MGREYHQDEKGYTRTSLIERLIISLCSTRLRDYESQDEECNTPHATPNFLWRTFDIRLWLLRANPIPSHLGSHLPVRRDIRVIGDICPPMLKPRKIIPSFPSRLKHRNALLVHLKNPTSMQGILSKSLGGPAINILKTLNLVQVDFVAPLVEPASPLFVWLVGDIPVAGSVNVECWSVRCLGDDCRCVAAGLTVRVLRMERGDGFDVCVRGRRPRWRFWARHGSTRKRDGNGSW
jgi:hypothetical protein